MATFLFENGHGKAFDKQENETHVYEMGIDNE